MNFHLNIDLKIVFLGPANAGKTSIICKYVNDMFQLETLSTIGAGFFSHSIEIGNNNVTLLLWDTAGEERFRAIAPSLLHGANGLVLVSDLTNPLLDDLQIYYDMFINTVPIDHAYELPILVYGNKLDIFDEQNEENPENEKENDEVKTQRMEELSKWCEERNINHCAFVSAKTGENIENSIVKFATSLIRPPKDADNISLFPGNGNKNDSCC
ncbi:Ras-related protein Rab-7b [Tritrichomonas foetus]|uniref:Ras-related protein Rab-7b n=1 Tax=Tritrichomonas foetus TaxID=1144522 RepID=A0A1J4KCW0_9EUKA|nr:Ras-related protein Rab-7b [Tritrichomonas foetus]|eukprot:OHT09263.1 Ras-related protein Rab-7b [Tritrichomonas foetus]